VVAFSVGGMQNYECGLRIEKKHSIVLNFAIEVENRMAKLHIKKEDEVLVLSGKDKGKTGIILSVLPEKKRAVVESINMIKLHVRPSGTEQGGIIEKEGTVHFSNLKVICPNCGQATRTFRRKNEREFRERICKKCNQSVEVL